MRATGLEYMPDLLGAFSAEKASTLSAVSKTLPAMISTITHLFGRQTLYRGPAKYKVVQIEMADRRWQGTHIAMPWNTSAVNSSDMQCRYNYPLCRRGYMLPKHMNGVVCGRLPNG